MIFRSVLFFLAFTWFYIGCTGIPKGLEPVSNFDGNRYMGKWYEIARLDHSFERNLSNVTAEYARADGDVIKVLNRGYNEKTGEWKQVEGRARFLASETVGSLKVSFFGPFYGGYHIIALDSDGYSYAMVTGPNRSYLWILARTTSLDENIYSRLVDRAAEMGFDTASLMRVKHDRVSGYSPSRQEAIMQPKASKIFTPCPDSPNCVSSLADNKRQFIEPIPYTGERAAVQQKLLKILESFQRVRITRLEDDYIRAEFKSLLFRFVDDVELLMDDVQKVIHVKSASRTGHYDLGVNRRRLEKVKTLFAESDLSRMESAT